MLKPNALWGCWAARLPGACGTAGVSLWVCQQGSAFAQPLAGGSGYLWTGAVLLKELQGRSGTRTRPTVNQSLGPGIPSPATAPEIFQEWFTGQHRGMTGLTGSPLQDFLPISCFLTRFLSNMLSKAWGKGFREGTVEKQGLVYSVWNWSMGGSLRR